MIDFLVKNAVIITVDPKRRVFMDGAIAVDQSRILDIGPSADIAGKYEARNVLDGRRFIAMPGLINCHMHLAQVLMRGVSDNVDVMDILTEYIWLIQGHYTAEDALTSSKLGLLEMIKSGTTAFLSTGLHPRYGIDAIAQAVLDSGIRAVLSKYVMDITGYALDQSALHPGMWENRDEALQQAEAMIKTWHGAGDGRIQAWYSPRSVGGVSPELFKEISALAARQGVGMTTHWAEIQNNVDYTVEEYGMLPVEFAESVDMLGKNVTFAHGICLKPSEIELLAESGTSICHCPVCNMKLAMGAAPVPAMLAAGVNVCLGNDGMIDNNTADMFREMRTALLLQRNTFKNPAYPTAAEAVEMATINGARAIMAEDEVGSLEVGKRADIILIDTFKPHLQPVHDPVSTVVWSANGGDVDTVLINGQIVMENRRILTMDEDQILKEAMQTREKIINKSGAKQQTAWPML